MILADLHHHPGENENDYGRQDDERLVDKNEPEIFADSIRFVPLDAGQQCRDAHENARDKVENGDLHDSSPLMCFQYCRCQLNLVLISRSSS